MVVRRFVSHTLRARNPLFDADMAMGAAVVWTTVAMADRIIYFARR